MTDTTCGETIDLATGDTLTCALDPGHYGPLHDDHGHQWGDANLPIAGDEMLGETIVE